MGMVAKKGAWRAVALRAAVCLLAGLLVGCGGGGDSLQSSALNPAPLSATQCTSIDAQKSWLHGYMVGAYYWSANLPAVDPAAYGSVDDYFYALRWEPTDRYSFTMSEQDYLAQFQAGQTLGYGIAWTNDPVYASSAGDPGPIRVAYVESGSPAATAGVTRGDTLVSVNGAAPTSAAVIDLLYPTQADTPITLELRPTGASGTVSVALTAATVTNTAVFQSQVLTASNGRKVGYLVFNQFLAPSTTMPMLRDTFRGFRQAGLQDLVLDLRYNGGGYVSMANELAAMIAGTQVNGSKTFIHYLFNDRNAGSDYSEYFVTVGGDTMLSLPRVFVLTSVRTASASELVVNALKPYLNVIQIGATSYGKPVGQIPTVSCGQMFAPIVFETVNAAGNGGYFNGIAPSCTTVLDDLDHPLGASEAVLGQAMAYVAQGACPVSIASARSKRTVGPTEAGVHAAVPDPMRNRALLR